MSERGKKRGQGKGKRGDSSSSHISSLPVIKSYDEEREEREKRGERGRGKEASRFSAFLPRKKKQKKGIGGVEKVFPFSLLNTQTT